jgi:hypothetical protein
MASPNGGALSQEGVDTEFSAIEPFPHIQIGHSMKLQTFDYETKVTSRPVIEDVQVQLFVSKDNQENVHTWVWLHKEKQIPARN